ncbi:alpha-glucosidase, partial [Hortaea werneckii]
MPADGDFTYQFLRAEPDGSYIYEDTNRTISTGDCGSTDETDVQSITTSSPDGSSKLKRSASSIPPQGADLAKRQSSGDQKGLPDRDLINPPYMIDNAAGSLSNKTIDTSLTHYGGWKEYDTHNLYGAMMSEASRIAMLSRRPSLRPLVITRSTFAGSGRQVGHWLGDNISDWFHYLISISQMLDFGALFQVPMVGSDVCGFGGDTNELLCARWATLGAFYPFYRNHNELGSLSQEFYRWPLVAEAARNAINIRYQLLDYFYTSFYEQTVSGTPAVQPMFFAYPEDENTFPLGYQFFWGPGIMVAPVTEENSTSTTVYMPDDIFYDFYTHEAVRGQGEEVTLTDIAYTTIPLYYKGGSVVAMRSNSSNTTTALRKEDFTIVIAPGLDGTAKGSLYLDDGVSLEQGATSYIHFHYSANGEFRMEGTFDYESGNSITSVMVLGSGDNGDGKAPGNSGGHRKDGGHGKGSMGWHGKGSQKSMQIPLTGP